MHRKFSFHLQFHYFSSTISTGTLLAWVFINWVHGKCREFNQNSNLWETKQIEKTHVKENNHTHKTIFMWFGNLPTSTKLQGFHYKIRRYNSVQEHSQETQFPMHPNSLSPTRQENTILSSYAAARLLGIISNSHGLPYITNLNIYIYICHRLAITRSYNPTCTRFPNTVCI